ncbi:MAG: endolytic transglycosylase MltG [Caldilineaceae bacterium]|nr:endolytic transglycosylase MltG [Caldilineaceae bacterium]
MYIPISRSLVGILILILLVLAGCNAGDRALSVYLRMNQAAVEQPYRADPREVRFEVEPGTPARVIGSNLVAAGLIGDDRLFEAYVRVNGLVNQLEAGTFVLSPSMTLAEIVEKLQNSAADSIRVTIPEGWRIGQIVDLLDELGVYNESQLATLAQYAQVVNTGDLTELDLTPYPFLQTRLDGMGLEGYLFPNTYEVPAVDATVEDVLGRQLDGFANTVMPAYQAAVDGGKTTLDLYAVLTLASIVEREAVVPEERPAIARVYLNRLAQGIRLEADPTVQYAMGYQPESDQWWKTPVFLEEYSSVDSPYNTYLYAGLPPGPICNPGLSSIQAVLEPDPHNYLFFVAVPGEGGRHVFAETFAEHQVNVQKYLGQ